MAAIRAMSEQLPDMCTSKTALVLLENFFSRSSMLLAELASRRKPGTFGIHAPGLVNVHQARDGTQPHCCPNAGHPEVARHQHFVAGADVGRHHGDAESAGARVDDQGMLPAKPLAPPVLKCANDQQFHTL